MSNKNGQLFEFGEFTLDGIDRVLYRNGQIIDLPPKVFDTLLTLVESDGTTLSKDQLMAHIWGDSFVEEGNLTQNIYSLRQLFGKRNDFIKTVPRRGYRFTARVQKIAKGPAESEITVAGLDADTAPLTASSRTFAASSKFRYAVATGLAAAILGAVGFSLWQKRSAAPTGSSNENLVFERLTSAGNAFSPVISPDGRLMAYVRRDAGKHAVFLKDIESGNDVELKIENDLKPDVLQFMPDGSRILFRPDGRNEGPQKVYEISYFGGQATVVADDVWGIFSISPDGENIAFYRGKPQRNEEHLVVRNLKSGDERVVAKRILPGAFLTVIYPAWSSDGKTLAFVPFGERSNRSEIAFVDVATGEERIFKTDLTYIRQLAFLPDDQNMLVVARDKAFQVFKYNYVSGRSSRVTNDLNNYRHLSLSANGKRMVTQQRKLRSDIWLYPEADEAAGRPLTEGGFHGLYDIAFTKNGEVVYDSKGKVNRDLRVVVPSSGADQVLSRDENTINNHAPDSDRNGNIYFVSDQSGSTNIWRIKADGSGAEQVTSGNDGANIAPAISPDGNWLYYVRKSKQANAIWRKPLSGSGEAEKVFESKEFALGRFTSISPDGKWLAFHYQQAPQPDESQDEGEPQKTSFGFLDLADLRTIKAVEISVGRKVIRWTNGGKTFDHNQNDEAEGRIWRIDLAKPDQPPKLVFRLSDVKIMHFAWSPDERDLVITKATNQSDVVMLKLTD